MLQNTAVAVGAGRRAHLKSRDKWLYMPYSKRQRGRSHDGDYSIV